jgi:energy-coupling factor transporter ATP-binding protein EcfA2
VQAQPVDAWQALQAQLAQLQIGLEDCGGAPNCFFLCLGTWLVRHGWGFATPHGLRERIANTLDATWSTYVNPIVEQAFLQGSQTRDKDDYVRALRTRLWAGEVEIGVACALFNIRIRLWRWTPDAGLACQDFGAEGNLEVLQLAFANLHFRLCVDAKEKDPRSPARSPSHPSGAQPCQTSLSDLRLRLSAFRAALALDNSQFLYAKELAALEDTLRSLRPPSVCFVGHSKAGKSSLLGTLIGVKLPSTGGPDPTTSASVEVKRSVDELYRVIITFLTQDAWKQRRDQALCDRDNPELQDGCDELLEAVYGCVPTQRVDEFVEHPEVQQYIDSCVHCTSFTSAQDVERHLIKFTCTKDAATAMARAKLNGDMRFYWPLVEKVELHVPSEWLPANLTLVDLPGVGDFSQYRRITYESRPEHIMWVTPGPSKNDRRFDQDMKDLHSQGLLRNHTSIVVTKIDEQCAKSGQQCAKFDWNDAAWECRTFEESIRKRLHKIDPGTRAMSISFSAHQGQHISHEFKQQLYSIAQQYNSWIEFLLVRLEELANKAHQPPNTSTQNSMSSEQWKDTEVLLDNLIPEYPGQGFGLWSCFLSSLINLHGHTLKATLRRRGVFRPTAKPGRILQAFPNYVEGGVIDINLRLADLACFAMDIGSRFMSLEKVVREAVADTDLIVKLINETHIELCSRLYRWVEQHFEYEFFGNTLPEIKAQLLSEAWREQMYLKFKLSWKAVIDSFRVRLRTLLLEADPCVPSVHPRATTWQQTLLESWGDSSLLHTWLCRITTPEIYDALRLTGSQAELHGKLYSVVQVEPTGDSFYPALSMAVEIDAIRLRAMVSSAQGQLSELLGKVCERPAAIQQLSVEHYIGRLLLGQWSDFESLYAAAVIVNSSITVVDSKSLRVLHRVQCEGEREILLSLASNNGCHYDLYVLVQDDQQVPKQHVPEDEQVLEDSAVPGQPPKWDASTTCVDPDNSHQAAPMGKQHAGTIPRTKLKFALEEAYEVRERARALEEQEANELIVAYWRYLERQLRDTLQQLSHADDAYNYEEHLLVTPAQANPWAVRVVTL